MFTIMHEQMDGTQQVFAAMEVQHIPYTEQSGDSAGVHLLCGPGDSSPGIKCGHLKSGRVFVMNDKGTTVARFYLDQPKMTNPLAA